MRLRKVLRVDWAATAALGRLPWFKRGRGCPKRVEQVTTGRLGPRKRVDRVRKLPRARPRTENPRRRRAEACEGEA